MQQCACVLQTSRRIAAALCAIKGLGLLPNKQACGLGYPHALLAATKLANYMVFQRDFTLSFLGDKIAYTLLILLHSSY